VDLQNPGARFGTFYLDNVSKNGETLTEENRSDDYTAEIYYRNIGLD